MTDSGLCFAIAAGGTAGHVNPALALAEELRNRGHRVVFYGQQTRLEATLVPEAGFEFVPVTVSGLDRSRPWTGISSMARVLAETKRLCNLLSQPDYRPNLAIGFGAYVEVSLLQAARRLGIPCALHEQNSVAGLANKMMSRHAAVVAVAHPAAEELFRKQVKPSTKIVLTGNPVRQSVLSGSRERGRAELGAAQDDVVLLIFGGSLGATHINERVAALKKRILAHPKVRVLHSTGAHGYEDACRALSLSEEEKSRWQVVSYIDNMGDVLAAADLALSRSGASSVAELAALAVPSILVPYPRATADHQTANARLLADAGAAVVIRDARIDEDFFADELQTLLEDGTRRAAMRRAAQGLGQDRAAQNLADVLEQACVSSDACA